MMQWFDFNRLRRRKLTSLLGLSLSGSRLEGVVLKRVNGSLQSLQSFSVTLTLDPLTADVELVGREIRNHLDAAGVRERNCVVALPLKWALTAHTQIPEMAEEDIPGFLQIEAERGFHYDVETLQFCASRCRPASGRELALLVGIPRNHLTRIEQALRAAKLKPAGFSMGIVALQPPNADASNGVLALAIGESNVGLQITCGGGVAALRALEGALEVEGSRQTLHPDVIARETRITLGQLPDEVRSTIRQIRIFGPRDLAQQLADEVELRLESMDLKVEVASHYAADEFGLQLPPDASVSAAFSLAAAELAGRKPSFDFQLPRITPWKQVAARYSSGKFRMAGAAAAAIVLIIIGVFAAQQWQLVLYQSRWAAIASKVRDLKAVEQQVRQFRPWYDDTVRGLTILKQIANAFPEDGVVSAKTLDIRDLTTVTCTGVARDNKSLLKTMERISASPGVSDFHEGPIRGKSPIQFTFSFSWSESSKNAN